MGYLLIARHHFVLSHHLRRKFQEFHDCHEMFVHNVWFRLPLNFLATIHLEETARPEEESREWFI